MATTKLPTGVSCEKLIQSIKDIVHELKNEFQDTGLPINDDNKNFHSFCEKFEYFLKYGQRERTGLLGGRKDYWDYMCKCLTPHRSAHDALKFVKANSELKTSLGRGRALVRYCLVHHCMADILQQCISDPNTTAYFYLPASPLLHPRHAMGIVTTLYELGEVAFDLAPSGYDLDVAWPTFSRSMPGGHSWRPPSRAMSISSLVSHASQYSEAPPPQFPGTPSSSFTPFAAMASPVPPDGPAMDQLRLDVARSETARATLEIRVTQLEEDNAQLLDRCRELEQQLEQARENARSQGEKEHEAEKQKLTNEIKMLKEQLADSLPKLVHEMLTEELTLTKTKLGESNFLKKELEASAETLRQQLKEFEENEKQLKSTIQTLELKLEDSLGANDRLSCSVKDLVRDNEASDSASTSKVFELIEKMTALESERSDAHGTVNMYKNRLESLERDYQSLQERCQAAEEEKAVLRNNIRKVSSNWFERKARISDSESEGGNGVSWVSVGGGSEGGGEGGGGGDSPVDTGPGAETKGGHGGCLDSGCKEMTSSATEDADLDIKRACSDALLDGRISILNKMDNVDKLVAMVNLKNCQLALSEKRCGRLYTRMKDYEKLIEDQTIVNQGLERQLSAYFQDNQKMSQQLGLLSHLFEELEITQSKRLPEVKIAHENSTEQSDSVFQSAEEVKALSSSVSKCYTKLKDLIYEKKSLVTEIERLKTLNVELQRRVLQQESRLHSVSDALHTTWMIVSDLKDQHAQLHTHESVLRYELKGKREILNKLRDELECSREQWTRIRQKNSESEQEWHNIREELDERRRQARIREAGGVPEELEGAVGGKNPPEYVFEPPVDLLVDMGIEYGCIDPDDDTSATVIAVTEGEDVHAQRLQGLEEQCCYLYQKLMNSTSRSLVLARRLTELHEHYGSSDEDEDDHEENEEDDNEEDHEDEDVDHEFVDYNNDPYAFESEMTSPDTESYDTAYVSEADGAETGSASGAPGALSEEDNAQSVETEDTEQEDGTDDLSRRLINFLPKKIELLRRDNRRLEEKYNRAVEEKMALENQMSEALETERKVRKTLEEKLEHVGKCVDELKLERSGKISEAEEKLRQKMEKLSEREETLDENEKQIESLKEEIEQLTEKFEERGMLLQAANNIHKQVEAQLEESKHSLKETQEKCQKKSEDMEEYKNKARDQEALLMQAEQELEITKARLAEQEGTLELVSKHQEAMKVETEELRLQASELRLQLSTQHIKEEQTLKEQVESAERLESLLEQMASQEQVIHQMEEQLHEVREESGSELAELRSSMCEVSQMLATRDEECAALTQQLSKMKTDYEFEKKEHKRIKEEQSRTMKQLKSVTESKKQLEDDMKNLTEKLVQLIKEKDALWQSNTRLLEMGQGHGAGWMEDKNVTKCLGCNSNFSLMLRKHHCRACGRIFCNPCSDNWVHMASSSKRVRVCDGCFTLQSELAGLVTSPLKRLQEEEADRNSTDERTASSTSAQASTSTVSRTKPLPIGQQPDDDEFSVISDDEIQKSLSASSPYTPSPTDKEQWQKIVCHSAPTLKLEDLLREPINDSEVWVNAGSKLTVPLVLEPGVTLLWKFVSEPKSISFAVMYHPRLSEVDPDAPDVKALIPTTRVASAQRPVTGKLLAKQPGIYTLVFDNSFSRFIAKKITYSLKGSKESQTVGSPSAQSSHEGNGD